MISHLSEYLPAAVHAPHTLIIDVIDIAILSFILYRIILLISGTRSLQMLTGIFLLLILYALSRIFNLHAVHSSISLFFNSLSIIIVILFSNEIKKGLSSIRLSSFFKKRSTLPDPYIFDRLYQACEYFSAQSIGALIAIERDQSLKHYADSGTILDARISSPLLVSIFSKGSPLHDGAILIDKNLKLMAASCILPLTVRIDLKIKMGTRHRSAIGLTEETDCLVIVVSEETRTISFFEDGIQEKIDLKDFNKKLRERLLEKK